MDNCVIDVPIYITTTNVAKDINILKNILRQPVFGLRQITTNKTEKI